MEMEIDISTPAKQARFLVRLGIYEPDDIAASLVRDYPISIDEARRIVARAVEFDKRIDA